MRTALSWTSGAPAAREKAWSAMTRAAARARPVSARAPGAGGERRRSNVAGALMPSAYPDRVRHLAVEALDRLHRRRGGSRVRLLEDGVEGEEPGGEVAERLLARGARARGRARARRRLRLQARAGLAQTAHVACDLHRAVELRAQILLGGLDPRVHLQAQGLGQRLAVQGEAHRVEAGKGPGPARLARGVPGHGRDRVGELGCRRGRPVQVPDEAVQARLLGEEPRRPDPVVGDVAALDRRLRYI